MLFSLGSQWEKNQIILLPSDFLIILHYPLSQHLGRTQNIHIFCTWKLRNFTHDTCFDGSLDLVLEGRSRKVGNLLRFQVYTWVPSQNYDLGKGIFCSKQMDHPFFQPLFGLIFNPPQKLLNVLRFNPLEQSLAQGIYFHW